MTYMNAVYSRSIVGTLFRGPRPDTSDGLSVKCVFNLETGWFEFFHGPERKEREWCKRWDITYVNWRLSDFWAPNPEHLKTIVKQIDNALNCGDVLVHCLHGKDRTGMVCAAWRILKEDWSVEKAVGEMLGMGFHHWAYWYWIPALRELK